MRASRYHTPSFSSHQFNAYCHLAMTLVTQVSFIPYEFDPPGTYPPEGTDWTQYCESYGPAKAALILTFLRVTQPYRPTGITLQYLTLTLLSERAPRHSSCCNKNSLEPLNWDVSLAYASNLRGRCVCEPALTLTVTLSLPRGASCIPRM